MQVILSGYPSTKKIISASSWLLSKYFAPFGNFDITFLNIGEFDGKLFCGKYHQLPGGTLLKEEWPIKMAQYLETLDDDLIIIGDDDFFLSQPIHIEKYHNLLFRMERNPETVCAKLCICQFYRGEDYEILEDDLFVLSPRVPFSVALQYGIWRREYLIELLWEARDPWDFETRGTAILSNSGNRVIGSLDGILKYPDRSAVSTTWPGKVSVLGNQVKDIEWLCDQGYLNRDELQMGMWNGENIRSFEEGKNDQYACCDGHYDEEYNKLLLDLCLK